MNITITLPAWWPGWKRSSSDDPDQPKPDPWYRNIHVVNGAQRGDEDQPQMTKAKIAYLFVMEGSKAFWAALKKFFSDVYNHAEAIVLLILSSIGLNLLLQEIPFYVALPMWVEAAMVIPVLSVIGVQLLTWSASNRAKRRVLKARATKVQVQP